MDRYMNRLLIPLLVVIFLIDIAYCIKCYQCTSANESSCDDPFNNSSMEILSDCKEDYGGKTPFCRKVTQTILDEVKTVRVRRSCGWEEDPSADPCYRFESDFHIEVVCVCHTDGCNSAPLNVSPTSVSLVGIVVLGVLCLR